MTSSGRLVPVQIKANDSQKNSQKIYIIGPRASGKSTFLGALLSISDHSKNKNHKRVNVNTISDDSDKLRSKIRDGWRVKKPLDPTNMRGTVNADYEFSIKITTQLSPDVNIRLSTKDYGGEFFQDVLLESSLLKSHYILPYIKECLMEASAWIVLLPDFCLKDRANQKQEVVKDVDGFYKKVFRKLLSEIPEKTSLFSQDDRKKIQQNLKKLQIAIVMSKCERGELWTRRKEPERDLFQVHLKNTRDFLRDTQKLSKKKLDFFALSSFGVLSSKDPRPNRINLGDKLQDGAMIKDFDEWRPFGLINPLYWIATKKRWKDPSF